MSSSEGNAAPPMYNMSASFNNTVSSAGTSASGSMPMPIHSTDTSTPVDPLQADSTSVSGNSGPRRTHPTSSSVPALNRVSTSFIAYSTPAVEPVYLYKDPAGIRYLDTCQTLAIHWKLNIKQQQAINRALHDHFSLFSGQTRTGKTYAMAATIWLMVIAGNRVLACTPSKRALEPIIVNLGLTIPHRFYPHLRKFPVVRLHRPGPAPRVSYSLAFEAEMALLSEALDDLWTLEELRSAESGEPARRRLEATGHYDRPEYTLPEAIILLAREDAAKFASSQATSEDGDVCKPFRTTLEQYNKEGPESVSQMDQDLFHELYKRMTARVLDRTHIVLTTLEDSVCDDLVHFYEPDIIAVDEADQDFEDRTQSTIKAYPAAKRIVLVGGVQNSNPETCTQQGQRG